MVQMLSQTLRPVSYTHLKIKKVRLYEVSVVTFPAYEATSVQARKNEIENIKKRQIESWRFSMLKKLKGEKENA